MTFTIEDPDMIESMPEDEIIPDVSPFGGIEDAVSGDKIRDLGKHNPPYLTAEDAEHLEIERQKHINLEMLEAEANAREWKLLPIVKALASNPSVYTGHAHDADKIVKLAEQIVEAFDRAMNQD